KVRDMLDMKRDNGQFIGAFAPYGYLTDPEDYHHLVVNPETAPVVKDIFRWYMEGMSKSAITKELIRLGIPSPYEYKRQHGMKCFNPQAVKKGRSEEHTSELQSRFDLVCRLLLEKKNQNKSM